MHFFFSYSRTDSEFVLRLARELREVGVRIWLDQLDIAIGQRWDETIEGALKSCQGLIAVLSPASIASVNVMDEVSYALEHGKLVVPVLVGACDVPFRLRRVQRIDFTAEDYRTAFTRLVNALQSAPSAQNAPQGAAPQVPAPAAAPLDWKERIVDLKETFRETEKEKAHACVRFICDALAARGWPPNRVAVLDFAATEVLDNAFLHGLGGYQGQVTLEAHVTDRSCSVGVTDGGAGFDLRAELGRQSSASPEDHHGLAQVSRLVSDFGQPGGARTVQFTLLRDPPVLVEHEEAGVCFLEWVGRMDMGANFDVHLEAARNAFAAGQGVGLDLSRADYIGSVGWRVMMLIAKMAKEAKLRVVAISPSPLVMEIIQISKFDRIYTIVGSREEAVEKLKARI